MTCQRQLWTCRILLLWAAIALCGSLTACSIFFGEEDAPKKSADVHYEAPNDPYTRVDVGSADRVWQSTKTGNTIAFNSSCGGPDRSIQSRVFLAEVKELNVKKERSLTVDGVSADRIRAEGKTEGVPISVDVITYKKGNCTYDLAYVARTASFEDDHKTFEDFVGKFHAP